MSNQHSPNTTGLDPVEMCVFLDESFSQFSNNFEDERGEPPNFHLNSALLATAINQLIADISRHKSYTERPVNKIRIASYTAFWIQKTKPIQINQNASTLKSTDFFVNEMFAAFVLFSMLGINEQNILEQFYFELIYQLRFRSINAEDIYMIGTALQQSRRE